MGARRPADLELFSPCIVSPVASMVGFHPPDVGHPDQISHRFRPAPVRRRVQGGSPTAYGAWLPRRLPRRCLLRPISSSWLLRLLDAHERIDNRVDVLGINRCFVSGEHLLNFGVPLLFREY